MPAQPTVGPIRLWCALALLLSSALTAPGAASEALRTRDPQVARLERTLPDFATARLGHFVLLSDAEASKVDGMLATMEATSRAVERFADRYDLARRPLDRPLVAVAFGSRERFETFARRVDGVDARWMTGYWLPGADRTVFRTGPAADERIARRSGVLAGNAAGELATVAHETAHQVLHRLGIQRRSAGQPLFIREGLAIAFERIGLVGPEADPLGPQPDRSARVARALRERRLAPLALLVTTPGLPAGDRRGGADFYDQSWALTIYLATRRADRFTAYLRSLAAEAGRLDARRSREIFERAFGPLAEVERDWRAWLRSPAAGA